jgi:hypothetical protein
LTIVIALVAGYLVWHFTRANQARLGIRSRKGQISNMRQEIRKMLLRGTVVLVVLILLLYVAFRPH